MKSLLEKLNIQPVNAGACTGPDGWLMDPKGKELVSYNPTTGEAIAKVVQATAETYEQVASTAQQVFLKWREVPAPKRGEVVRDLGNALRELKEPLGDLVTVEMGKIRAEGHGEVQEMIDICDFAVGQSRMLYGLSMHSERPAHRMYEQWHPLGILGLVTAFNFPVAVWSWNSALAAICGDTIIWKPSSYTPLTAVAVTHIANKVMADHGLNGIFNLAIGSGRDVGELLLNDPRIKLVSFTGSTQIGIHVSEAVARRFGRTILELGGNNGIIVSEKADLDMATRAILFGAVGTAGQRCTSTRRIIVQKSIAAELSHRLVDAYKQVCIGDPLEQDTLMGPLVVNTSVEEMMDAIKKAVADGGEVLCGGKMLPNLGPNFVE
ncbi:MAG TPA: aldehyde dehydrogenase family protein, partial [Anaerolineales bacterium]|nr:aldehyde dehydrogenase family protein [Anaerolineales bacterium]